MSVLQNHYDDGHGRPICRPSSHNGCAILEADWSRVTFRRCLIRRAPRRASNANAAPAAVVGSSAPAVLGRGE